MSGGSRPFVVAAPSGTGKTTVAAALGTMAALELGGKVLVLTVDPARRLATALGLEAFGNVEKPVPASAFAEAGLAPEDDALASVRPRDELDLGVETARVLERALGDAGEVDREAVRTEELVAFLIPAGRAGEERHGEGEGGQDRGHAGPCRRGTQDPRFGHPAS